MAEEKTINLFQTESNPDPYAGRDPSLYGTVDFPTANFITMVKSGEITYNPEDTMHQKALQEYQAVYDEATELDKANMLDPAKILAGATGGTALGYLGGKVGGYFDSRTPTEKVLLPVDMRSTLPADMQARSIGDARQLSPAPVSQSFLQDIKTDFISEAGKFENIGRGVGAGIGAFFGVGTVLIRGASELLPGLMENLKSLEKLDGKKLLEVGKGLVSIGAGLGASGMGAAFAAGGMFATSIIDSVREFFGMDTTMDALIKSVEAFGSKEIVAPYIEKTSKALSAYGTAMAKGGIGAIFTAVGSIASVCICASAI